MNWLLGKTNQAVDINARISIVAIVFLSVIGPCVFILQPGYVQGLVEYLGFNDVQAGYIASGEMFGVAACTIIMVFLSQKYNWRGLVAICLGICTLGNLLSVSVTDFETLYFL